LKRRLTDVEEDNLIAEVLKCKMSVNKIAKKWSISTSLIYYAFRRKNKSVKGRAMYRSRFTKKRLGELLKDYENGVSPQTLVEEYKVSYVTIRNNLIALGKWKNCSKLSDDKVREILEKYYIQKVSKISLSKEYPVSISMISRIISGERFKHIDRDVYKGG